MEFKIFRIRNPIIWFYINIGTYEKRYKRCVIDIWFGWNRVEGISLGWEREIPLKTIVSLNKGIITFPCGCRVQEDERGHWIYLTLCEIHVPGVIGRNGRFSERKYRKLARKMKEAIDE